MDLVSSTLDKYLRHRFDVQNLQNNPTSLHHATSSIDESTGIMVDGQTLLPGRDSVSDDKLAPDACDKIEIYSLIIHKMMPCCVSIRHDMSYIAAAFENSQIYTWNAICDNEKQHPSDNETKSAGDDVSRRKIRLGPTSRFVGHSGPVYSIQFTQKDDLMLSCSEDTTIRLWCLKTKCNLFVYRGHSYPVWSISIAPQGIYFSSASMDMTARLWTFDKMCPLKIFCGHEDDVECVKFHPNGKYLATGSSDSTVRLWSISDGRMVRLMVGHKRPITNISFLPDGKFLASISEDSAIRIWNLTTNSVTNSLNISAPSSISLSPHQEFVSSCGCDNVLRLWQVGESDMVERKIVDFSNKFSKILEPNFFSANKLIVIGFEKETTKEIYEASNK